MSKQRVYKQREVPAYEREYALAVTAADKEHRDACAIIGAKANRGEISEAEFDAAYEELSCKLIAAKASANAKYKAAFEAANSGA